jgi:predicted alpha/beta superfamily hydrolase
MRLIQLLALAAVSLFLHACGAKKEVTFLLKAPPPAAKGPGQIFVAGDFNGWKPNDPDFRLEPDGQGQYVLKASFPAEITRILYKYTRGDWTSVETSASGGQVDNRALDLGKTSTVAADTVASWTPILPPHTSTSNVRLLHETFHIPQLDRVRRIWVYVPTGYEQNSERRYPVIYFHDGQNLFDERYAPFGEWGIDESLNDIERQFGHSAIIVGIEHGDKTRIDEYSPYRHAKHGGGEGKRYLEFVVNTLKPYIDGAYRTLPAREHTGIGGSSMGGLISFCAAMYYPQTFGKLLVCSPSFWFSEEIYQEAAEQLRGGQFDLYMSVGKEEVSMMVHGVEKMETQLKAQGMGKDWGRLRVHYMPQGKHQEASWREEFPRAYRWLFQLEE